MLNFLLAAGLSFGTSFLASLFGPGQKPITQSFRNLQERWDVPLSRYGEEIPTIYGTFRVPGYYLAAQIPPDRETDVYFDPVKREETQTIIYYGNCGVLWCRIPGVAPSPSIEKIYFNKTCYYNGGTIDSILGEYWGRFEGLSLNNYYGSQTTPDSYLSFQGSNWTAYHGLCYTAFHRLRLNNSDGYLFNGNYPGFEAEITTGTLNLAQIIGHILETHGYAETEYDASELTSISVRGFATKVGSAAEKLSALQLAYNFEIVDTGAKLKFITQYRPSASALIPLESLAAHESGQKTPELFQCEEILLSDLPTQIRITYRDFNKEYQESTVVSFSIQLGQRANIEDIDLTSLVLTASEALNIANRELQLRWIRRYSYKITILSFYTGLEAGDVIEIPFDGGDRTQLQIKRINEAANGLISLEAFPYDAIIYSQTYTAPAPNTGSGTTTQGSPIFVGQTNIYAVTSVTNLTGTVTYIEGVDYTVNLTAGTITPIVGGGISNGTQILINYQGQETPTTPPTPPVVPPLPSSTYPRILSFSPPTGKDGDAITIYGSNFTGTTTVTIAAIALASFSVIDDSTIAGTVGTGTTTGKIEVTNADGSGESLADFVIVSSAIDWGGIGGDLADQTDLKTELDKKREKTRNTISLGTTKNLAVTDAYYQSITPTIANLKIRLPTLGTDDLVEYYIENQGDGTNSIDIEELSELFVTKIALNSTSSYRGVFCEWNGSVWNAYIRSYYV
jgi:hypothetical protein